nr:TonB family protein [uncultured Cohaesibacter sp.]
MKRVILWLCGIGAGVLLHLAIAFAYWADLEGESRYDLGGAFLGNMQVSIMPDMGQGLAGGDVENLSGDVDPVTPEVTAETDSVVDATPVDDTEVVQAGPVSVPEEPAPQSADEPEADVVPASAIEPQIQPQIQAQVEPDSQSQHQPEPQQAAEALPTPDVASAPEVSPVAAEEISEPDALTVPQVDAPSDVTSAEYQAQAVEEAKVETAINPTAGPDVLPPEGAKPEASEAPAVEPAVVKQDNVPEAKTVEQSIAEKDAADQQEPEPQPTPPLTLAEGGALSSLPVSAPRPKVKPAATAKRQQVADASASDRKAGSASASDKPAKAGRTASAGSSGKASIRGDGGTSNLAAGAGSKGVRVSYATELRRWIERHKRYPRSAKMRGVEGTGVVRITIDRAGRVLQASLVQSAGDRVLDDEIRQLPKRASPAPKPPEEFSGSRHTLTLPVRFTR